MAVCLLEDVGLMVESAEDGVQAVAKVTSQQYALLLKWLEAGAGGSGAAP